MRSAILAALAFGPALASLRLGPGALALAFGPLALSLASLAVATAAPEGSACARFAFRSAVAFYASAPVAFAAALALRAWGLPL